VIAAARSILMQSGSQDMDLLNQRAREKGLRACGNAEIHLMMLCDRSSLKQKARRDLIIDEWSR